MEKSNPINANSLKNILTLRYDPTRKSLLTKKTWRDFVETQIDNPSQKIENLVMSNIKKSMKHSKKTSIALSSGVDSTLMLALLKESLPETQINAISIKFSQSVDESKLASKIASKLDVDHHIIYVENYLNELPKAISIIQQPFWDLHWYHVVKTSKNFGNSLVSGDGGDELFGGYTFRYEKFLSLISKNSNPLSKVKAYLQCHERDWVPDQEKIFGSKLKFTWDRIHSQLLPYFKNSLEPLSQVFLADFNGKLLYNWVPLNSKIHQYFKIKPITPILSKDMINFATHIPASMKYDSKNNIGKIPLRQLIDKYSLSNLLTKKKQGFSVDTKNLWTTYGYDLCNYYLSDSRVVKSKLINNDWIQKHLKKNDLEIRYVNKFLGLLALEIWYRLFVTKEIKSNTTL